MPEVAAFQIVWRPASEIGKDAEQKLRAAFRTAAASPEFAAACAKIDAPLMYLDGPDYAQYVAGVYRKETQLIDKLKLRQLMNKG